jgi:hypothetical protein
MPVARAELTMLPTVHPGPVVAGDRVR